MNALQVYTLAIALGLGLGCKPTPMEAKVQRQKAIYFSVSDVPRKELEKEITRTMKANNLTTPGQAMVFILNKSLSMWPSMKTMIEKATAETGVILPPQDPLDVAEARIKEAREMRAMAQARDAIARIELEDPR